MDRFESDAQIINYIRYKVENIDAFAEHRLYREEQYQFSEIVFKVRNSVEWMIRINKILQYIKYSVLKSLDFAMELKSPMDENEIKDMYTYYLEDSVYRLMVLWDMYKQLVNEFYSVGFRRDETYSIFRLKSKLRNEHIWEVDDVNKLESYLNSDIHQFVRNYLRNTFTHSVDPTSMNIFHDFGENGVISFSIENMLPRHPYENLVKIVDDLAELINLINHTNRNIEKLLLEEIILVKPIATLNCNEEQELDVINILDLTLNKDNIGIIVHKEKCTNCEYVINYEGQMTCKPRYIKCSRIHEGDLFNI